MSKAGKIIKAFLTESVSAKELSEVRKLGSLKTIYKWRKLSELIKAKQDADINLNIALIEMITNTRTGENDNNDNTEMPDV